MCLYTMQPSAHSDSRREKGALLTNHNKITSVKKPNQMKKQLRWPQELKKAFKQMHEYICDSRPPADLVVHGSKNAQPSAFLNVQVSKIHSIFEGSK